MATRQDLEHLKLLSIFYYIVGGLYGLFSCFPLIYIGLGLMMLLAPQTFKPDPPPPLLAWFVAGAGIVGSLLLWALTVCLVLTGRFLSQRRGYIFCLVVAGILCAWFPFGTVLGVFTFVVLTRPSVRELFRRPAALLPDGGAEDVLLESDDG